MSTITMTAEQTEIYDNGGQAATRLLVELRREANAIGGHVEVYTADGIVVAAIDSPPLGAGPLEPEAV